MTYLTAGLTLALTASPVFTDENYNVKSDSGEAIYI